MIDQEALPLWAQQVPEVVKLSREDPSYRGEVRRAATAREQRWLIAKAKGVPHLELVR